MAYDDIRLTLVRAREEQGLSKAALARKLNMTRGAVGNWEEGRRRANYDDLARWAGALGLNLNLFLSEPSGGMLDAINQHARQMDRKEQAVVLEFVQLLQHMDARDRFALTAYIGAVRESLEAGMRLNDELDSDQKLA